MSNHKPRFECAVCSNPELRVVMDYGPVPLAGDFPLREQLKNNQKYNLSLQFCSKCGLLQTGSMINEDLLFKEYRYMSSVGLTEHFKAVAAQIKSKFNPRKILEIGSNDVFY